MHKILIRHIGRQLLYMRSNTIKLKIFENGYEIFNNVMLIYQGCTVTILNTAVRCPIDCDLICFFYHILFYYTQLFLILFYVGILNLRNLTFLCKHLNVCLFYFSGIIFDFTLDFTLLLSCIIINWTALFLVVFKFIFLTAIKTVSHDIYLVILLKMFTKAPTLLVSSLCQHPSVKVL